MIKMLASIRRRSDLNFDAFKNYYETGHSRLVTAKLGSYLYKYVRNYISSGYSIVGGSNQKSIERVPDGAMDGYDCLTELWFESQDHFDTFMRHVGEGGDLHEAITTDEANFIDRSGTRIFLSEMSVTENLNDR